MFFPGCLVTEKSFLLTRLVQSTTFVRPVDSKIREVEESVFLAENFNSLLSTSHGVLGRKTEDEFGSSSKVHRSVLFM